MSAPYPWQRTAWARFAQARAAGRLAHAWLLSGPAGVGKRDFAHAVAAALLCTAPAADGGACGRCRGCRTHAAGHHPDWRHVAPAEPRKPIRVDQIRELTEFLGGTAQFGGDKVVLIEPAEQMNVNAANSLLKTLEEPPPHSVLLLVSECPGQLPATVRSRCQVLAFPVPPAAEAGAWLAAQEDADDAGTLLALAGGAPLRARALRAALPRRRGLFDAFAELVGGRADPVRTAEIWAEGALPEALDWLVGWHQDMIRLTMAGTPPRLANPDVGATLRRFAAGVPAVVLFERLDAAVRARELATTTQANTALLLEEFFIGWAGAAAARAARGA